MRAATSTPKVKVTTVMARSKHIDLWYRGIRDQCMKASLCSGSQQLISADVMIQSL